ncbi:MAG: tetratricopeptide repeat protein [Desulfobacteraceae bacterium]|jgi:Tfp pilus assembly protein PilF
MKSKLFSILYLPAITVLLITACSSVNTAQNKQMSAVKRDVGEAYMRQGDYTAALRELLEAEKLFPEDPILHNDLGLCYMNKKRMADAVVHFKRAVALKPSYAPARNNLGTAYLALKQWDTAIGIFKEITKDALYGTPHYPLSNIGLAYYHKGQYQTALSYYKKALKIQENFINALRGAGRSHLALNDGRMALRYLERAVKYAPKMAQIHYELGEAYLLVGRTGQAVVSYETAVEFATPESDVAAKAKQRLRSIR